MSERTVAQQGQEKFQFYLLSLVFTLLALSVQTAKIGTHIVSDCIELAGWALLLASGIAGLWFMEINPTLRVKMAQKGEFEDYVSKMRELQLKGQTTIYVLETSSNQTIAELIVNRQDAINVLKPLIERLERHQGIKYQVFRYCFVAGLLLVAAARVFPAFGGAQPLAL